MVYRKPQSMKQQLDGMKQWPCFSAQPNKNDKFISWLGRLQPSENGDVYVVEIQYSVFFHPYVRVWHPIIKPSAPHINHNGSLCLYHPNDPYHLKWTPDKLISETIACWTAEWLAKYGLWIESGIWYGLEAPHNVSSRK